MDLEPLTVFATDNDASAKFYPLFSLQLIVDSPPRYARFVTEEGPTFSIQAAGIAAPPTRGPET